MEESFAYSCPNCGGTVTYNNEKKKWICDYCSNEYDKLYNVDGNKLDDAKTDIEMFYYRCESCGNSFYSTKEESVCSKCKNNLIEEKEVLAGIVKDNVKIDKAKYYIAKALRPYSKKYNIDLNKVDIQRKNIKADLINGSVLIKNKRCTVEYLFSGVLYPYLNTNNYKILYDFINEGYNSVGSRYGFEQSYYNISKEDKDNNIDDNLIRNKILDACKDIFIKQNGNDEVIVEDNLKIKKSMLMTVYYYSFNYDGKDYNTYYINNYSNGLGVVSLDVPKDSNITKEKLHFEVLKESITKNISTILFIIAPILLMLKFFEKYNIPLLIIIILFVIGIILKVFSILKFIKIERYKEVFNIDEALFYKNIVENSMLVKKIRR